VFLHELAFFQGNDLPFSLEGLPLPPGGVFPNFRKFLVRFDL